MSGSRVAIVVGIVALAGGAGYFVLRGDKSTGSHATAPASAEGSGALLNPNAGKAAISAPAGPSLATGSAAPVAAPTPPTAEQPAATPPPALPATPPTPSAAETFATQQRDPSWAGKTEAELRKRIPTVGSAKLEAAECRHDACQLTIAGEQDDVAAILAKLESPKGLSAGGFAMSIMLTAPEQRDGKLVLRAYAQFNR